MTASGAPPSAAQAPRSTSAYAPLARAWAMNGCFGSAATYHGAAGAIFAARQSACSATCAPEPSTGGQEDQAGRIGIGLDADLVERLDAALAGRRQAAARRLRRRRTDQDELALGDQPAVVDQALGVERLLGVGDVQQRGVDLAVANRIEHGERRPGNEQDGDPGIGAEGMLQAARQSRFDQRAVGAEPQRPAALARLRRLGERRAAPAPPRVRREGGGG